MSEDNKTVATSTNTAPWDGQQGFLTQGFNRALDNLNSDSPQYYPGQTVTDTTQATTDAQTGTMAHAQQAAGLLGDMTAGKYLDAGNPHFQGMVDQIGQAIRPSIDSTFAGTGRLGSGSHQQAFSSALADQAGRLAYQNYGDERTRQIAAAQDYSPYSAMSGVGAQQEAKQGQYLSDAAQRWDFEQNKNANKIAQYMNLVGNRSYGQASTSTQPYTSNGLLQGLGTGVAAAGALGQLGQGAGGLLKLFGG